MTTGYGDTNMSKWIVSALGGSEGQIVQNYLDKMIIALESYFHPANSNLASGGLHMFIKSLCNYFVHRLHNERHNKKWNCKTPMNKRLSDENIGKVIFK